MNVKLNLGGNEKFEGGPGSLLLKNFTNVDINHWEGVDIVCDVRNMYGWKDESVAEIRASHLIEHFERHEIPGVLQEWRRILVPGGLLRIYCPNAEKIAYNYSRGVISGSEFNRLLFGNQTYGENYHKIAIDRTILDDWLRKAGFRIIGRDPRPKAYKYDLGIQAIKQ